MLDAAQLTAHVIVPTLREMSAYSRAAGELVLGTAAQESRLRWIKQLGDGPALGLWQMEPATYEDLWLNWLRYRWRIAQPLGAMTVGTAGPLGSRVHPPPADEMIWNLRYACAMCRVHYLRVRAPLPAAGDLGGQADYWKRYYNTVAGKGRASEYVAHWSLVATAARLLPA